MRGRGISWPGYVFTHTIRIIYSTYIRATLADVIDYYPMAMSSHSVSLPSVGQGLLRGAHAGKYSDVFTDIVYHEPNTYHTAHIQDLSFRPSSIAAS